MFDGVNNPFGFLPPESPVHDLSASEINRIAQSRPSGYRAWTKVRDGADKEASGKLRPVVDGADILLEEHNAGIIEGLFIPTDEESLATKPDNSSHINLDQLRRNIQQRRENPYRESVSPKPNALRNEEDRKQINNVIPISRKDIESNHDMTEKLSKSVGSLTAKHIGLMLSFDNASSYAEAFAEDGLGLDAGVQIEDSPMHFLSNLCSIETMYTYLKEIKLPKKYKDMYMEKIINYFFERGQIDSDSARKSELLSRYHKSLKAKGHINEDENTEANRSGSYVARR